jgi:hypothetical protein
MAKKRRNKSTKEQVAMLKLYLYKAVDIVTQRERKCYSLLKEMNNMMLMGLRRFLQNTPIMPNIVALRK